ncbi:Arginase [Thalassovita gelatinovora]|uniref:Arginase n=1 Tax=Thalassovita gelatinovora TaxID=53501 RepID=A0A0P1F9L7_THAGE|nr:arginase [Thalassovita gelatinovora]QIZ81342.1 arginase [Thalassovita gelatinovora]CUH64475.1 Arginase [Thalassovita gelatinovora]SEP97962.1 arginase [Thalassovita gelatinovora]
MTHCCHLIGAPVQTGASQPGCLMGPAAFRTAGLPETLRQLGWDVVDRGNVTLPETAAIDHANGAVHNLAEMVGWTRVLSQAAYDVMTASDMPIFMGGDHSMAAGTVSGVSRYAAEQNRPLFVLWLDAHPDLHTLDSTGSGNLHGTPVAYFTGQSGFDMFPPLAAPVDPGNICMMGIRSVDPAEHARIKELGITVHDMRTLDERGVAAPLSEFLARVAAANGLLHVSLDVDFLDPAIAPAVGTTVPGGATFREAHLIMEMLHDSGLVGSLDLVELNPFLDERGRTALLMTDLTASLFGRRVLDRMTRSFA